MHEIPRIPPGKLDSQLSQQSRPRDAQPDSGAMAENLA